MMPRAWRLLASGSGSGQARRFLRIWAWYERWDLRLRPNQPIPGAPYGICQVTFVPYRGEPFELPDGTLVERGDLVCRLHICNPVLMRTVAKGVWHVETALTEDLRALAAAIEREQLPREIRAIFGITVLARAGPRLGFVVRRRQRTVKRFLDRVYLQGLLALYCRQGVERLAHHKTSGGWPEEVWMSRTQLLRRYAAPFHDRSEQAEV